MSEPSTVTARRSGDVIERGLLIGGENVPASSGSLVDDISPWDGEIYAHVAAGKPEKRDFKVSANAPRLGEFRPPF